MSENIITVEKVELTKEEKKAIRKARFKKIAKYTGIGLGIAAVSGITCYFFGKACGTKEILASNGVKLLQKEAAEKGAEALKLAMYESAKEGFTASEFTDLATGAKDYLIYTVTNVQPAEWVDTGENVIVKAGELVANSLYGE